MQLDISSVCRVVPGATLSQRQRQGCIADLLGAWVSRLLTHLAWCRDVLGGTLNILGYVRGVNLTMHNPVDCGKQGVVLQRGAHSWVSAGLQ